MRIHCLQHVPFEGPAAIEWWAREKGYSLQRTRLFAEDTFPSQDEFDLLVILGGPMSVHDGDEYPWLAKEKEFLNQSLASQKVILGICLGAQLLSEALGGEVYPNEEREIGWFSLRRSSELAESWVNTLWPEVITVFHWHGETFSVPQKAVLLGSSDACENQGFMWEERVFAFQFHLETTSQSAHDIVANCSGDLSGASLWVQSEKDIRDTPPEAYVQVNNLLFTLLNTLSERINDRI